MEDDKIIRELDKMKLYKNNGYDYLLNLSIRGITKNKINDLESKINEIKKELNKINKLTSNDLWKNDLNKIGLFKAEINFHSDVRAQISIKVDKIEAK